MELKERIMDVSGELFVRHGVKNTSMDEIASRLGISKRTIYENFKNKEDILFNFLKRLEQLQINYVGDLSKNEYTVVHVFLRTIEMRKEFDFFNIKFLEDIEKYYPRVRKELKEQQMRGMISIKRFLKEGMAQNVIREDLNIEIVAYLLQDSNRTFINASRITNKPFSNWEVFFTSMINFIRGISTAKGIEIVDQYLKEYYSERNKFQL